MLERDKLRYVLSLDLSDSTGRKGAIVETERVRELREKAAKARRFAQLFRADDPAVVSLLRYAEELEGEARELEEVKEPATLSPQAMEATHEPSSAEAVAAFKTEDDPTEPSDG